VRIELDGHWYGQGTFVDQRWPLENCSLSLDPFETTDRGPNIQCPAWFSSDGRVIALPGYQDLSMSLHNGVLEIGGATEVWEHRASDARAACEALLEWIGPPARQPSLGMFGPIWTTWAEYKRDISQEVVLDYAKRIAGYGYRRSVIEIDDIWQRAYGDLLFDPVTFPDPRAMVDELHRLGFAVTLWVPWFLNPDSALYADARARGYLLAGGELVPWWCEPERGGGLLDCANPDALEWFVSHLRALCAATGVDGFKFDGGEASWIREALRSPHINANALSDGWASLAARFEYSEARTGWWAQRHGVPMRQWDKFSTWGTDNGLASVVPQALAMSLIGYPYVLPDMVGGNEYGNECTPELMVRWAQATALLPMAQFSVAPWRWGDETMDLVRRTTFWRDERANLFDELVSTGGPIVRPVFWLAPDDERALRCGDEFLLGEDLLVAPVVTEGARSREVYLPPGEWYSAHSRRTFAGPDVIEVDAPLHVLPCFGREGTALDTPL
jgi:alpha-glucosidase (family GH31 glycosyl hydrolase)